MEDPHFLCAFLHRRYHVKSISYTALPTDSAPAFNRGDDGIAGNDDKDDDEAIDDDYYCFICLLGNAWSALPYATCCIFIFRPDGGTLVELQDINSHIPATLGLTVDIQSFWTEGSEVRL